VKLQVTIFYFPLVNKNLLLRPEAVAAVIYIHAHVSPTVLLSGLSSASGALFVLFGAGTA
jgi:hypothetical protein